MSPGCGEQTIFFYSVGLTRKQLPYFNFGFNLLHESLFVFLLRLCQYFYRGWNDSPKPAARCFG